MTDYEIGEFEAIPRRFRGARYDGINNDVIGALMTAECTIMQLQGSRPALLLRRPGVPDHVIQVGDWVTVDDDLWVTVSSPEAFERRARRVESADQPR